MSVTTIFFRPCSAKVGTSGKYCERAAPLVAIRRPPQQCRWSFERPACAQPSQGRPAWPWSSGEWQRFLNSPSANGASDGPVIFGLRDAVEAIRCELQAVAVTDTDLAAYRTDQAFAFEDVQGDGDALPAHAKQQGQEFV